MNMEFFHPMKIDISQTTKSLLHVCISLLVTLETGIFVDVLLAFEINSVKLHEKETESCMAVMSYIFLLSLKNT